MYILMPRMSPIETFKRYLLCTGAIKLSAAGIAVLTRSGLGTSQISSLPYVASLILPVSLGTATFIMNAAFVLAQFCLLGRRFGQHEFLQLPLTAFFSLCIDVAMSATASIVPALYAERIGICLIGAAVLALGISLQVLANVAILPGEGLVRAVARKTGVHFGTIKMAFDFALVIASVIASFACLGKLVGVREGTIISALLVGPATKLIIGKLEPLAHRLSGTSKT